MICDGAADVCLGVPYFNWGPPYVDFVNKAAIGTLKQSWQWLSPDFKDINNLEKSPVGFAKGPALSPDVARKLDQFTADLVCGLDHESTAAVWNIPLTRCRDSGTAVIFSSAELDEILQVADRIFVFSNGELMMDSSCRDVKLIDIGLAVAGITKLH